MIGLFFLHQYRNIDIKLDGGYGDLFESMVGKSCIKGCLIIQGGCAILKGMAIGAGA